jgi:hypothetical protein
MAQARTATLLDWVTFPDWLDLDQACHLAGYDHDTMQWLVDDGCVDLDDGGRIEKRSLWEYIVALVLVLAWAD